MYYDTCMSENYYCHSMFIMGAGKQSSSFNEKCYIRWKKTREIIKMLKCRMSFSWFFLVKNLCFPPRTALNTKCSQWKNISSLKFVHIGLYVNDNCPHKSELPTSKKISTIVCFLRVSPCLKLAVMKELLCWKKKWK